MSGTISLCLQQQFDNKTSKVLSGGLIYMLKAGTTTPQDGFRDAALSSAYPNPITLDTSGRIPQIFFADGVIRVRATNAQGVQQFDGDNMPVIGSAAGGGGVDTTDVNALFNTGDVKVRYGTGVFTGYVRANARTIGSASSGASERANADTQALFQYLWNNDVNLTVSGGRGASAVADYTANKTIALPDFRGCAIAGLDDMGNSNAGRLTVASFPILPPTTLGAQAGLEQITIGTNNLPAHTHAATVTDPGHGHNMTSSGGSQTNKPTVAVGYPAGSCPAGGGISQCSTTDLSIVANQSGVTVANANTGGGQALPFVQPTKLITVYIRL